MNKYIKFIIIVIILLCIGFILFELYRPKTIVTNLKDFEKNIKNKKICIYRNPGKNYSDINYLLKQLNNLPVEYYKTYSGIVGGNNDYTEQDLWQKPHTTEQIKSKGIELLKSNKNFKVYLRYLKTYKPIENQVIYLQQHLPNYDMISNWSNSGFLVSEKGIITNLHYDETLGCVLQIYGNKRWIICPPSEKEKIDWNDKNSSLHRRSKKCDKINIDFLKKHNIKYHELFTKPGDVIHCPLYYLHYVETISPISISSIFRPK
tara:strand:- start:221 stop:1006 length:786 start_codon:yes stop_codon:yes gene_type:complete